MGVEEQYADFREALMKMWDTGYTEGLELDFMLADTKDYIASIGDPMDRTIDMLWEQWKEYRGV